MKNPEMAEGDDIINFEKKLNLNLLVEKFTNLINC